MRPEYMSKSEIITAIVAAYGAVLSTFSLIRQWQSDRAKVQVSVQRNMEIFGDPRYTGKTLTVFRITNVGRRPVTITTFGAIRLHPHTNFVGVDSSPQLPR